MLLFGRCQSLPLHRPVIELAPSFFQGLLGEGGMEGPQPHDPVPEVDLTSLTPKALTALLHGSKAPPGQTLADCKPKRAARRAIRQFLKLSNAERRRAKPQF